MSQQKRYRVRYEFQLDLNKPEQVEVADMIELLKNERAYSAAVRDGLRIISQLREGKIDFLLSEYPWIEDTIGRKKSGGGDDDGDLRSEIIELRRAMADLAVMSYAPNGLVAAAQDQVTNHHLKVPDKPELVLIDEPMDADSTGEFLNMFDDFG